MNDRRISRLRCWRNRNEIESQTMAALLGVDDTTYHAYERGTNLDAYARECLRYLFDDRFRISTLLGVEDADDESVLADMDAAFRVTMASFGITYDPVKGVTNKWRS